MKALTESLLCTVLVLLCLPEAYGQGAVLVSGEFQVNTYTSNDQRSPSVAGLADGGFAAVWKSDGSSGSDSDRFSIQGQRYAADGTALGEQFQVNSYTTSGQLGPSVAALADGSFVTVWSSDGSSGSDSSDSSVQGQRYAADGTPLGGQFQVNSYTTDHQGRSALAALADGGFVAVWHSDGSSGSDPSGHSIQGQRYAFDGTPLGGEFQVNSYTAGSQLDPSVAALTDGGFVVMWHSYGSNGTDSSRTSIQGQRFAADGMPLGQEFQVNSYTTDRQSAPSVAALEVGGFLATWYSFGSSGTDDSGNSIQGQRFAADGAPLGPEFQLNSATTGYQYGPSVVALADSSLVAVWDSQDSTGSDSSSASIQGQRYSADGAALGGEFQINSFTESAQWSPSVAALADGGFVVAWQSWGSSGSDASGYSIQGQRFTTPRYALVGLGEKCLDTDHSGTTPGTRVILYSCDGSDNQRWKLELTSLPQRAVGVGGQCLIPGPVDDDGHTRAVMGECGDGDDLWRLITDGHASPSFLVHEETGHCLDVKQSQTADFTPILVFPCDFSANQVWRPVAEVCTRDSLGLCLNQERFRVDLEWLSFDGSTGFGRAVPVGSDDSGLLWFFQAENWEMLIKVLDGCDINDRLWVFAAATTTVEYTLRVTDTHDPAVREYFNPLNNAAPSITDTDAFDTCPAGLASRGSTGDPRGDLKAAFESIGASLGTGPATAGDPLTGFCVPGDTEMCLRGRFQLEVTWRDHAGNVGPGRVIDAGTPESGMFWFFDPSNWEMLVKVLDGCDNYGGYLFIGAATTDVEYTLTITDTDSGSSWQEFNPLGTPSRALVRWLPACP